MPKKKPLRITAPLGAKAVAPSRLPLQPTEKVRVRIDTHVTFPQSDDGPRRWSWRDIIRLGIEAAHKLKDSEMHMVLVPESIEVGQTQVNEFEKDGGCPGCLNPRMEDGYEIYSPGDRTNIHPRWKAVRVESGSGSGIECLGDTPNDALQSLQDEISRTHGTLPVKPPESKE